jgi:hypothetical protein
MKLNLKKYAKTLTAIAMFGMIGQEAMAQRIGALDNMVFTLSPKAEIKGPVLKDNRNHAQYGSEIVNIILKEAHNRAKSYLDSGDHKAYYSFLMLALTVPMQEGLYIHFRQNENDGTLCNAYANSGDLVKDKSSKTVSDLFQTYFKKTNMAPDCSTLSREPVLNQIIRGGDGSDMGIMQISIRWHYERYYAPKQYLEVDKSVRFGLNHIMGGFRSAYSNASKYSCIRKDRKSPINYEALVRGSWAGIYNSGNLGQTCRFADPKSAYKAHDEHFKKNLDKMYDFVNTKEISSIGNFKFGLPALEEAAVIEVINNFKRGTNNRANLAKLLAR